MDGERGPAQHLWNQHLSAACSVPARLEGRDYPLCCSGFQTHQLWRSPPDQGLELGDFVAPHSDPEVWAAWSSAAADDWQGGGGEAAAA